MQVSKPRASTNRPPYRRYIALERLLRQVEMVRAEILACSASAVAMPASRREELEAAFEGCCAEAQNYWEKFTPEDRAVILRARARVIGNRPYGVVDCTRD